jgi:hypothetical protein
MVPGLTWLQTRRSRILFSVTALCALAIAATVLMWPSHGPGEDSGAVEEASSAVPAHVRSSIDRWIESRGLNRYGDPPQTRYAGGNPLMDPHTGRVKDRYEYILEKHPELRAEIEKGR